MDNIFQINSPRGEQPKKSKFTQHKEQTIKSLQEVENFLNQTKKALNHFKLYKILK